jgi:hypothetical protein
MLTMALPKSARFFVGLAAAAAFSCEPATGPGAAPDEIAVGTAVSGALTTTDNARFYSFTAEAGASYVVFATVAPGALQVEVDNSAHAAVAGGTVVAGGAALTASPAVSFTAPARDAYHLVVRTYPAFTAAQYTVLVFRVMDGPEQRGAVFTIGDTVADSIEPVGDVDVYTTQLQAGEDVVATAEAPDAAGPGQLLLTVLPETGSTPLATGLFPAGGPASTATRRIHASASGTYRFRVSATVVGGALHGAYRLWTWAVNHAPERVPAALPYDTVLRGEFIDRAGDIDEFTFMAAAGAQVNAFYQSAVASHLDVVAPGGAVLGTVTASANTDLFHGGLTETVMLPETGTYTLRVSGDGTALAETGPYQLFLYGVDRGPEKVPAAIAPGDTVSGEAIDLPGDVDEFTFPAAGGRAYYAFLQAGSDSASIEPDLRLDVVDSTGAVLGSVESSVMDSSLTGQMTTVVTPPDSGTLMVRVTGVSPLNAGPYRLLVYAVDPGPESGPDTLALGDSVSGQAIDVPGDVDTYRVHAADSTVVNLAAAFSGTGVGEAYLTASLTDSASGAVVTGVSVAPDAAAASGGVILPPGTYLLRVAGGRSDGRPVLWGPYRVWLFTLGSGP